MDATSSFMQPNTHGTGCPPKCRLASEIRQLKAPIRKISGGVGAESGPKAARLEEFPSCSMRASIPPRADGQAGLLPDSQPRRIKQEGGCFVIRSHSEAR
jgi:hypothetical protein